MSGRRRPMRRLGDLLPEVATSLGLDDELAFARAMAAWERAVREVAPRAAGATRLLQVQPGVLVVAANAPIVAQEVRLQSAALLRVFAESPDGRRARELRVVLHPARVEGEHRDGV